MCLWRQRHGSRGCLQSPYDVMGACPWSGPSSYLNLGTLPTAFRRSQYYFCRVFFVSPSAAYPFINFFHSWNCSASTESHQHLLSIIFNQVFCHTMKSACFTNERLGRPSPGWADSVSQYMSLTAALVQDSLPLYSLEKAPVSRPLK